MNEGRGGVICLKKDFRELTGGEGSWPSREVGVDVPLPKVRDLARTLGTDFAWRRRGKEGRLREEGREGVGVTGRGGSTRVGRVILGR